MALKCLCMVGIGEMASRRALDAKFEVQILDPQLNSLVRGSFFVLAIREICKFCIIKKRRNFSAFLCLFDQIFFLMDMIWHINDHDTMLTLKLTAQQVCGIRMQRGGHAIV